MVEITPDLVLRAYAAGVFPMAEHRHDPRLFWVDPERRGVLPLESFRLSRRLRRTVRSGPYRVSVDCAFSQVISACAARRPDRPTTWINERIITLFAELNRRGYAHSVEVWRDEQLVGGLYGVAIGAAFFGESMFSHERDASKVALVHLVGRLIRGGFRLLDTQFVTQHLQQFGVVEISRAEYHDRLERALTSEADFYCRGAELGPSEILQSITQTS